MAVTRVCRALAVTAIVTRGLVASPATADDAGNEAAARALFDEARALMQAGSYARACPKLEAARRLYSGSGVLLNLGDCYEHIGRTASAFAVFVDAAAAAARLGRPDDEAEAKRRQALLASRLSRLSVRVTRDEPNLVVKRDGETIARATWGEAIAVDPGRYKVSAEAPGKIAWSLVVDVTDAATLVVQVPELKTADAPPPPDARPASAPPYWTSRRALGAGIAGAGVIGVVVGGALALGAKAQYDAALTETGQQRHDDSVDAVSRANVATLVMGAGAAIAAVGVIVWLTAPRPAAAIGTDGRAIWLRATF